jgi:LmbE family N-acetylglucosaminyl deacetylase
VRAILAEATDPVSTIVFFHAHPDDESLLTGGSMALLASQGHRVVLVTATNGEAGLAAQSQRDGLGALRAGEVSRAAQLLGCAQVYLLGYPDSGSDADPVPGSFATLEPTEPAERLAAIVQQENAHVLTGYDMAGGYGHRDHIQVHRVARAARTIVAGCALLEATVDRRLLQRTLRLTLVHRWYGPEFAASRFENLYSPHDAITHRIDVSRFADRKRAAMLAHASQSTSDAQTRSLERYTQLPGPLFRRVFGTEWYAQVGRRPMRRKLDNLLDVG